MHGLADVTTTPAQGLPLVTVSQYWGVMAPALTSQQGLTGMGRVFAGLGAIRQTFLAFGKGGR